MVCSMLYVRLSSRTRTRMAFHWVALHSGVRRFIVALLMNTNWTAPGFSKCQCFVESIGRRALAPVHAYYCGNTGANALRLMENGAGRQIKSIFLLASVRVH
jgi:hypothetical protein